MRVEGIVLRCDVCGHVAPAKDFPVANEQWCCPQCGADESAIEQEVKMTEQKKPLRTAEVAAKLDTDARTLRKFLRSQERGVGAGGRYGFEPQQIGNLKKQFNAWQKERETPKAPADSEAQ